MKSNLEPHPHFLSETEIEALLLKMPSLQPFWQNHTPLLIFRSHPNGEDPIYEIQLVWDLGDRVQTYAWIWVDGFEGNIIKRFPD